MINFRCFVFGFIIAPVFISCHNGNRGSDLIDHGDNSAIQAPDLIEFVKPFGGSKFKLGDKIEIQLKKNIDSVTIDSIVFSSNKRVLDRITNKNVFQLMWDSKNSRLGHVAIDATIYAGGKIRQKVSTVIQLLSDAKPLQYSYKILKTYPHSRDYYTQGLIYEKGYLYESDGLYTRSAIRKIKLETGEVVNFSNVDKAVFAEGIAIYDDKIYQLSWREKVGCIYDKNSLGLDHKFNYNIAEGWGLECNGQNFLMTDGSSTVYFMEPEYFTQVDKIEVTDDNGPVENLNELELVKGKLFANVYQKDIVVIINTDNGKVEGVIDFTGLLPSSDYTENTDVLNGIAYNPSNGHIFITGKNWPKLFEITIEPKK